MSINKVVIWLVVLGYLFVNVSMQLDFFAGRNIFDKYQQANDAVQALSIAQHAYYAKTAFLLILLILLASNVRFGLGFGVAFLAYALTMLAFFGIGAVTLVYLGAAIALLASYLISRSASAKHTAG
ncbi:hypothetical protein [Pseudoxanthomonas sp.]|uniref:hypothetical protein n=1 Tax=Pseudoxanthomonas sp. TaxID=1871049 RepID=UPI0026394A66|nr:hypothetical protein [Pseudoxanthomonas sp.]WDS36717.1 MAG: hypothetical protein O8I58_02020 [Pseudoxanthomonas sp.]